jgi:hypothetical protein
VQATHEEMLQQAQERLIAEEEASLKAQILRVNECSDTFFATSIIEELTRRLETVSDDEAHTKLSDINSNESGSPSELGDSPTPMYDEAAPLPPELDVAVEKLVAIISDIADLYIIEKKKKAVIEIEDAVAEMINNVDIQGANTMKASLQEVKR